MTEANCNNCGIALSGDPEEDDMHKVQMRHLDEDGEAYCEACFFGGSDAEEPEGEYEHTGEVVVRASAVDESDEELAGLLADTMQAEELRRWMSANGLNRARGSNKAESAEQAVEQDRALVSAVLDDEHGLAGDESGDFSVVCNNCGHEEWFGSAEAAEEGAESHKSDNPDHFPIAWAPDGRRIYG